jgi:uncharacterized SAM-binding protein YcdF (DUF218 family)
VKLRKKTKYILWFAVITLAIGIFAGVIFEGMGYYLVVRDPLKKADAIAVLSGGGPERIESAAALMTKGYGKKLILTQTGETDPNTNGLVSDSMMDQAASLGVKKRDIYVAGKKVIDTIDEAQAIKTLALDKKWKNLIIVTDTFHSRRTKIIFTNVFSGTKIQVRVNPVSVKDYWYHPGAWWKDEQSRRATINEYLSLISYKLGLNT